jgi:hypothetical protein
LQNDQAFLTFNQGVLSPVANATDIYKVSVGIKIMQSDQKVSGKIKYPIWDIIGSFPLNQFLLCFDNMILNIHDKKRKKLVILSC